MGRVKITSITGAYLMALTIGVMNPLVASADATIAYANGDLSGMVEDTILLPGITVGGSDPSIPMVISIDDGILSMTDTTGLTFTGSTTGSTIGFSGSVTDINNALSTLRYRSINEGTKTFSATIIAPGAVYNPLNGHVYEVVNYGSSTSWNTANVAAQARTFNGATGYLATITTQAEYDYLSTRLSGDGWFGASDATTEGDWQWVSGPEAGTSFWAGLGDGSPVDGLYSNWAGGEPNDSGGDEDCAQFYSGGSGWNDLPCTGDYLQYYVVEYGAPDDLPAAPESISFEVEISEPTPASIVIDSCLDLIDVYNNGTDNRYDILTLANDIDCDGETLSPMFAQEDVDFGFIGFRGEFDGNSHTISNVSMSYPSDFSVGLFAYANDAEFKNINIDGAVEGNQCVGGVVGSAVNSDFLNISSDVDVLGSEDIGGIVGCLSGNDSGEMSFTNSEVSGNLSATSSGVGGLIGELDLEDDSSLTIEDNEVTSSISSNNWTVGGLVGNLYQSESSILTIHDNTVPDMDLPNAGGVGGIVGYTEVNNEAQLTVGQNTLSGAISGLEYVGGYFGELYNYASSDENVTIDGVELSADVSSTDSDSVGGFAGYAENLYITNSSSSGDIYSSDDEAGGLIGDSYDSTISESYSTGTVEASDSLAGGLVGRNSETIIEKSYSLATVTGYDRVGGLVGANGGYISDSYARGAVSGEEQIGGLAGRCGRDITNSYSTGEVTGNFDTGGLLGYSDGCDVVDSFWDMDESTQSSSDGDETGKTTEEMNDIATFTDTETVGLETPWDFDDTWQIASGINDGYPCLQWQSDDCSDDSDDDGVASEVEDEAPNGGDANDDGVADSAQTNVSSFVNPVNTQYTVVEADSTCSLAAVTAEDETTQVSEDSGYDYSTGLINFTADCGTPGYTSTIRLIIYRTSSEGLVLRKHNPNTNSYFTIDNATITDVTVGGIPAVEVVYQIVDGGELDTDGIVNGVIVDPVGLATLVLGAPNTGFAR